MALDSFHRFYYDNQKTTWEDTFYLGVQILKNPLDLWIYQELLYRVKPDIIIECGTFKGGSALYLADICEAMGSGTVITIDDLSYGQKISSRALAHKRIRFFRGSSTSPKVVARVKSSIKPGDKVMAILDSDHKKDHVLKELKVYGRLVSKGSYLILEDTNINGHPVNSKFGPGPMEALVEFMKKNNNYVSDEAAEKFFLTFNPRGYLLRIK